jgi:dienelactone hydrolase
MQLNVGKPATGTRPRWRAASLLLAGMVIATGSACAGNPGGRVDISVSPATALLDAPVSVTISGLAPRSVTTVTAAATDHSGVRWSSRAQFTATATGTVSLSQASSGGSYTGVNSMGLFELMTPTATRTEPSFAIGDPGFTVTVSATVNSRVVATTQIRRQTGVGQGVTRHDKRPATDGIYAEAFWPPKVPAPTGTTGPAAAPDVTALKAGVLVFGGSEGGLSTTPLASTLAAHGYPALALAYFDEPGLPKNLANIPLEYFAKALDVLAAQPGVDPQRLVVWGLSRGSEPAMLLGVHYPDRVHAVIAGVPTSHVDGAYPVNLGAAWTYGGRPIPFAPLNDFAVPTPTDAPDSIIPVEQINGPVLTICGGMDLIWKSCDFSAAINDRLTSHHFAHPHPELRYPDAGHYVGSTFCYYSAMDADYVEAGGTAAANLTAAAQAHAALLDFLATANSG